MPKFNSLNEYIDTFNESALKTFEEILSIIDLVELDVKKRLFGGQVAFYVDENLNHTFHSSPVIVMSFLKDHVNIFANANKDYMEKLKTYKFTDKGTMQIKYTSKLVKEILLCLFKDSLQ